MLEGLPYIAILLLLLLLLLVLFLILLFIFLFPLCASRLSTRQSKVDGTLVLQRHVRQLSMVQVIIFQELKSFLRISIRTWLMDQNPCETSHFLAIGVLTQR